MIRYQLIVVVHVVDALLTIFVVNKGAIELNPIFRYTFNFGWEVFLIAKVLLLLIAMLYLHFIISPNRKIIWSLASVFYIASGICGTISGVMSWYTLKLI